MIVEFAFSKDVFPLLRKFADKFDCTFRIDEPSGDTLLFDVGDNSYRIDPDESSDVFTAIIKESLKLGKNLLLEKYQNNKVKYDDDMIY